MRTARFVIVCDGVLAFVYYVRARRTRGAGSLVMILVGVNGGMLVYF